MPQAVKSKESLHDDSHDRCSECGCTKAYSGCTGRNNLGQFLGRDTCGNCGGEQWVEPGDAARYQACVTLRAAAKYGEWRDARDANEAANG